MSSLILVVEDEPDIAALIVYHLARASYRVRTVPDGVEALRVLDGQIPDLIVLDLMLPGISGMEVLTEVRRRPETSELPIILLSARREETDRIEGLQLGADDYLIKPFSPRELILRIGAVLRRSGESPGTAGPGRILRAGPFILEEAAVTATVGGREVDLTPTEFKLLHLLIERRGRVQSRRELLSAVWEVTASITTRTVDMHVQRLRGKLGSEGAWIETVRGFGYRFRKADNVST